MRVLRILLACGVLLLLALHAEGKMRDDVLVEMLWACHVASLIVVIGALADAPRIVAPGFLFHLAVGIPGLFLDVVATGITTWTSVALHIATPLTGWVVLRGRGIPHGALLHAWLYYLVMQGVSLFTAPELNINIAHRPWGFLPVEIGTWGSRALNAAGSLFFLFGATAAARVVLGAAPAPVAGVPTPDGG